MRHFLLVILLLILGCTSSQPETFDTLLKDSPSIEGKSAYLNSPFVTAGNRVYLVGHQDGSFPELGWHIQHEMGGLWDHPIKLMDGFEIELQLEEKKLSLDKAGTFTNYPFGNRHSFIFENDGLKIDRWQFVPDDKEGILVQLAFTNESNKPRELDISFTGHADLRPTWLGERTGMNDSKDEAYFRENADAWVMKDIENPWFVAFGADIASESQKQLISPYGGKGISGRLTYPFSLDAGETRTITFVLAGSYVSEDAAIDTYKSLHDNSISLLKEKQARYAQIAEMSKLTIPDKHLQQTFEWLKYNCDWLVREVP
ncbi:MAG: glycogen debranching protein, partial [Flavobacteriaceae bacterium]|nr:glycogen debranching protein [Flavobacteriaceae bacterium]